MSRHDRRRFLQQTLAAAATITIAGTKSSGNVRGANDTIRLGVAGLNGRGGSHVKEFSGIPGVEITYLIDPDTRTYGKHLKTLEGKSKPQTVQDVRKALEDRNLDAISIATPNHWHSLMTVWACQAGKDVYVEKPCSHNVHEGRVAVETARKHNRVVQHGTQSRHSSGYMELAALVRSGKLGKLRVSRGLCYKPRGSIGTKPNSTPPANLDFNIWLGPAAERPFNGNLVHYNWHWFWDFGNGDIGNQGVHQMDIARWMIPGATLPRSVLSMGGRYGYTDQGETANSQVTVMDFGETKLIFEVRGLKTDKYYGQGIGNVLHFDDGVVAGGKFYPKGNMNTPEPLPKVANTERRSGKSHFDNFIQTMRSRDMTTLGADILEGHYSSALCHLANISYRLGQEMPFKPRPSALGKDSDLLGTLESMEESLTQNNGLKLDMLSLRVGRKLVLDAKSESFAGDAEANKLLTRDYRKPFALPG